MSMTAPGPADGGASAEIEALTSAGAVAIGPSACTGMVCALTAVTPAAVRKLKLSNEIR
jgi:hypothetical protein